MAGDDKNPAALKIPFLLTSEDQSPAIGDLRNLTYLAVDTSALLANQSKALFEKVDSLSNSNFTEMNLNSETVGDWKFLQNETTSPCEESVFVFWSFYFLRCLVIPCLLFYISWILWELRFLRMRDPSSPLPLPAGRMGFPIIGEMIQFFVLVSISSRLYRFFEKIRLRKAKF